MKNTKRLMSILIAVVMLIAMLPATAFARSVKGAAHEIDGMSLDYYKVSKFAKPSQRSSLEISHTEGLHIEQLRGETYILSGIPENVIVTVDGEVEEPAEGTLKIESGSVVNVAPAEGYKIKSFRVLEAADPDQRTTVTLTAGDVWGDGSGYQMLLDKDATAIGTIIPTVGGIPVEYDEDGNPVWGDIPAEVYKEFEYTIPEGADGALNTTAIVMEDSVTIAIEPGVYDWCITNPTVGDRMWIAGTNGDVDGRYDDFIFEKGRAYEFSLELAGDGDGVFMSISGTVEVTMEEDKSYTFTMPAAEAEMFCEVVEKSDIWDFEEDMDFDNWYAIDNDGDGYNWGWADASGNPDYYVSESHVMVSYSYYNGNSLSPDNMLMCGPVAVPENDPELKFWLKAYTSSWLGDTLGVYATNVDLLSIETDEELEEAFNNLTQLTEDIEAPETWTQYSADLSDFAGQEIFFILRHYNCYDCYGLLLDDVELTGSNSVVPGEGITVTPYPSTAFTEGTDYSVDGNVVTVTYSVPCSVGYLSGGSYVPLTATATGTANTYTFTAPEGVEEVVLVVRGDSDLNGQVKNSDATKIKSFLKTGTGLDALNQFAADADGNGQVKNSDATKIKAYLKGNTSSISW